ncbi:Spy/CpxP family protein refolding chaperone, partial [Guyparkeria sp.]|uniref:Spy/CpxP family protein refolding chaperone n=1 Tax=Guyparkeria sp. TaxID=2035736 RepID=UPI00356750F3
ALTDQQRQRLQEIREKNSEKMGELMEQMEERQRELYRLNQAPDPDYDAMRETTKAIGELQQQMAKERIEARKQMHEAVTDN